MRKLATIQKILSLHDIAGADRIVEAHVMGWKLIAKKTEFNPGDLCIFFEVDSILPEAPWSEFMRSKKFRIKTMKMKGVLSQGLALPLSILNEDQKNKIKGEEGEDLTELLGVTKYEPPILDVIGGHTEQEGPFPSHVPKTDEERVQSNLELLTAIIGRSYAMTVKIDGSSVTFTYDQDAKFFVCSRNFSLKHNPERLSKPWIVAQKYALEAKLKNTGLAIQAELIGPGIQTNRLRTTEPEILVFNIYDWVNRRHLNHQEMLEFCLVHQLNAVPTEEIGEKFSYDLNTLLEKAKGVYAGTQNAREGIVIRSTDQKPPRISFKVLNNDFLMGEE